MAKFKIVPLKKEYADKIRRERKDDFGNEVTTQLARGVGPCRSSLKPFRVGVDQRLLFKHSPFARDNIFDQSGPVFIHLDDVLEYSDVHCFPPEIKADKNNFPLSLIGYDAQQNMVLAQLVGENDVDDLISAIFDGRPDVDFLHVRNSEACCYICKVERV